MIQLASEIAKAPSMLEGKREKDIIDGIAQMTKERDTNMRDMVSKACVVQ